MSNLRVKKGPGRRPQSAKRQQFMELRARGWSIRAAGREVGISRAAAANWTRGYKVYRHGQVVGFVPLPDVGSHQAATRVVFSQADLSPLQVALR